MDLQKIASYGTAAAVVGTGAVVGGGQQLDKYQGGPEKREAEKIELNRMKTNMIQMNMIQMNVKFFMPTMIIVKIKITVITTTLIV